MITVLLPATLRPFANGAESLTILTPVHSIAELLVALQRKVPLLMRQLERSRFDFAVNDDRLPRAAEAHPLHDGDRVEIVPATSGE